MLLPETLECLAQVGPQPSQVCATECTLEIINFTLSCNPFVLNDKYSQQTGSPMTVDALTPSPRYLVTANRWNVTSSMSDSPNLWVVKGGIRHETRTLNKNTTHKIKGHSSSTPNRKSKEKLFFKNHVDKYFLLLCFWFLFRVLVLCLTPSLKETCLVTLGHTETP